MGICLLKANAKEEMKLAVVKRGPPSRKCSSNELDWVAQLRLSKLPDNLYGEAGHSRCDSLNATESYRIKGQKLDLIYPILPVDI